MVKNRTKREEERVDGKDEGRKEQGKKGNDE